MLELPQVTLIIVDCINYDLAKLSLDHCSANIKFGDRKILTHFPINDPCVHFIPQLKTHREASDFLITNLTDHFTTDFVLNAQWDGFVWHPESWEDEFLKYDYIGAPWLKHCMREGHPEKYNVGNGGFSIRSKRLQDFLKYDPGINMNDGCEDYIICVLNREYLEHNGFTFAPFEVADRFSWECNFQSPSAFGMHHRIPLTEILGRPELGRE